MEAAKQNLTELQSTAQSQPVEVHKVANSPCYRCGRSHPPDKCKFRTARCHNCGKIGHIQRACRSGPQNPKQSTSKREGSQRPQPIRQLSGYKVNQVRSDKPIEILLTVDNREVNMELDTGASVSLMSHALFNKLWPNRELRESDVILQTYSGEPIQTKVKVEVFVEHNGKTATLPLFIIEGRGPTLLGRNWLREIPVDWRAIHLTDGQITDGIGEAQTGVYRGLGKITRIPSKNLCGTRSYADIHESSLGTILNESEN